MGEDIHKLYINCISDKVLISKICLELMQLNITKQKKHMI